MFDDKRLNELATEAFDTANKHGLCEAEDVYVYVCGIAGEVAEAFDAWNKNRHTEDEELADVIIRCLTTAKKFNVLLFTARVYANEKSRTTFPGICMRAYQLIGEVSVNHIPDLGMGLSCIIAFLLDVKPELEEAVIQKMQYNKTRPFKHGQNKIV